MTYEDAQLQENRQGKDCRAGIAGKRGGAGVARAHKCPTFAAGKELRDTLLAIPDRITDVVMAEDNRAIIHNTIYDAIADALQNSRIFKQG